jgi:hypothetical protein
MVLGGVSGVIGVAALAVVGVMALGGHGGKPGAPGTASTAIHSVAAARTAAPLRTAAPRRTGAPRRTAASPTPTAASPTPSASATRSYAVDACLVGNWKDAGDVLDNTIRGQSGQFTGTGGAMEVSADGSVTQQLGPETLTATIAGNTWTEVLTGSITFHLTTRHGDMIFSDIAASPDAVYKLYENGIFYSTGPMSASTTPFPYTCSSSTLRMYWSDGRSTYDRER